MHAYHRLSSKWNNNHHPEQRWAEHRSPGNKLKSSWQSNGQLLCPGFLLIKLHCVRARVIKKCWQVLTFLLQLQQANDECNSAGRRWRERTPGSAVTVLLLVGRGRSGSVRAAFINCGQLHHRIWHNQDQHISSGSTHTLTCTVLLDVCTDHGVKKAYKSDCINDSFNIQCGINNK